MTFNQSIRTCFRKYVDFTGRAARSEYWWFTLFLILGNLAATIIDTAKFGVPAEQYGPLNSVFSLATLLPGIAVSVRRLHDVNRSGWWLLIMFIPLIGWLVLLFWEVSPGTPGANRFGPDPLGEAAIGDDRRYSPSDIPRVTRHD